VIKYIGPQKQRHIPLIVHTSLYATNLVASLEKRATVIVLEGSSALTMHLSKIRTVSIFGGLLQEKKGRVSHKVLLLHGM
jgi:hypothetical protein